jgi:DNA-binding PadR family transcriptional regulator
VYQEAKRLVDFGWAAADEAWVGQRKGTTYRITAAGRRALHEWLAQRGAPLGVESEALLRLFFSDQLGGDAMRAHVQSLREDAEASLAQLGAMAAQWEAGDVAFPDRDATNAVTMRLVTELHRTVARWADWAGGAVAQIERGAAPARRLAEKVYADIATEAVRISNAE